MIVPDYLDDEHREIRRLLAEISDLYAHAAEQPTIGEIRAAASKARGLQYDVEFRIHRAFVTQNRHDRARPDGR